MMWNTFLSVIAQFKAYFAEGRYGLLLLVCLVYFAVFGRKHPERKSLFWVPLVLLVIIFCPLTAKVIQKMIGDDVYWRVFWVLPVSILAACAGTDLICRSGLQTERKASGEKAEVKGDSARRKGRTGQGLCAILKWLGSKKQILAVLLCAGVLILNGSFLFTGENFQARENNYKLPTEVIWVADAINEHAEANHIKKKKIAAPFSVACYIRVYDASIRQRYGRAAELTGVGHTQLYEEVNADHPDYTLLAERAKIAKLRYVVLLTAADNENAMAAVGYEKIYNSPSYAVYFNTKYKKNSKK